MIGETCTHRNIPRVVDYFVSNNKDTLRPLNLSSIMRQVIPLRPQNYILDQRISTLNLKASSPDLKPIENVRSDIKAYINP